MTERKIEEQMTELEKERTGVAEDMQELRTAKNIMLTQIVELKNSKESLTASLVVETELGWRSSCRRGSWPGRR